MPLWQRPSKFSAKAPTRQLEAICGMISQLFTEQPQYTSVEYWSRNTFNTYLQLPKMRMTCLWNNIREEEAQTKCLKNCFVVIDGQNFFFNTYRQSKLPFVFGAEADEYAKYLKEKLAIFKKANIECYIVFKGSDTDIDDKIRKLWLTTFDFGKNYHFSSPVLMKEIYKQVLEELGIKYATSVMESKDDCVAIAQVLQCPVLSEDKEFYFKAAPYIPYRKLEYIPSDSYITCKQYHINELFQKYLLTVKKIAIVLALSDVTIFPNNYFNSLMKKWHFTGQNLPNQLLQMLKYISEHGELEVLNSILNVFISKSEKEKFMSQIEVLEKANKSDNVVVNYLLNLPSIRDSLWFETGVANQKIATDYVYLYKHKMIMGSWAIEKNDTVDSIMLSIDIIKYGYNLLTNFEPSQITVYQSTKKYVQVNTVSDIAKPIYHCSESVFENGWKKIKDLKLFEHFLVQNNINIVLLDELPEDVKMLVIALIYFARKKISENIQVTKEVYCFIISYVMLNAVFDQSASEIRNSITEKDFNTAKNITTKEKKYFVYNNDEAKRIFNENTLKTLAEIQYCLLHMNYLNTLCGSPFMKTRLHKTFNGTFIYKLLKDMNGRDEKEFIGELFKTAPSVLTFVNKLISTYEKLL
ncbi:unnamed protein product [Arctia plantaginis]|uniref:Uncharacterized protein n=1 Tax=Arctia plantaginis TaxID=874455 RepID=A0A8S1ACN9_ARCPL|nr:unnamed protein product [Arctia plantaginis]